MLKFDWPSDKADAHDASAQETKLLERNMAFSWRAQIFLAVWHSRSLETPQKEPEDPG